MVFRLFVRRRISRTSESTAYLVKPSNLLPIYLARLVEKHCSPMMRCKVDVTETPNPDILRSGFSNQSGLAEDCGWSSFQNNLKLTAIAKTNMHLP